MSRKSTSKSAAPRASYVLDRPVNSYEIVIYDVNCCPASWVVGILHFKVVYWSLKSTLPLETGHGPRTDDAVCGRPSPQYGCSAQLRGCRYCGDSITHLGSERMLPGNGRATVRSIERRAGRPSSCWHTPSVPARAPASMSWAKLWLARTPGRRPMCCS